MSFHLIQINEIYSNADGSIQFVELIASGPSETQLMGQTLRFEQQGQISRTFTFPSNLPPGSNTQGQTILVATQGFADLGLVTPDYILPANIRMFFSGTATVRFSGSADTLTYSNLPTDGAHSLNGDGVEQVNSPRNLAGQTAAITVNGAPSLDAALVDQLVGAGQALEYTVAPDSFSDPDGDALSWTATLSNGDPLPGWLAFDAGTHRFSGTPQVADAATLEVSVSVSDGKGGSASDVFSLLILSGHVHVGSNADEAFAGTDFADSLDGGGGNDTLSGGGGHDTLIGGSGADLLDGGAGIDTMEGGDGADVYVLLGADVIREAPSGGLDTVRSAVNAVLPRNVERLELTGTANTTGKGNGGDNLITGNAGANLLQGQSGNDTLQGGDGNDTLNGGKGADRLVGGLGNDTYIGDSSDTIKESSGGGHDVVRSSQAITLAANVEDLVLKGSNPVSGTGNTRANAITGNDAANLLTGDAGRDTLAGGGGADTLVGGNGNDVLSGGNAADTLAGGNGRDTLGGGAGADLLVFDSPLSVDKNVDVVTDFAHGTDQIGLDLSIFVIGGPGALDPAMFTSGAGLKTAQDADDRIVYNLDTGALYYDSDGAGGAGAVRIATLQGAPVLDAGDFLLLAPGG